jgi:hypothetical protein
LKRILQATLFLRYPHIFRERQDPSGLMQFGIGVGEGWYAVVEALCETLLSRAGETGASPAPAAQIKQKFGKLVWYHDSTDAFVQGAVELAEWYSLRVCERSGEPGRLTRQGGYIGVLSAREARRHGAQEEPRWAWGSIPVPPPVAEMTPATLIGRGPLAADAVPDLPEGWMDLADALLCWLHANEPEVSLSSLGQLDGRLTAVSVLPLPDRAAGAVAFASEISRRLPPDRYWPGHPPSSVPRQSR